MRSFVKFQYIIFLLFLSSCRDSDVTIDARSFTIHFSPSFMNKAKLTISRDSDSAVFVIDTSSHGNYRIARPVLITSRLKMEMETSLGKLWSSSFAKTLANKDPNVLTLDGMDIYIEYAYDEIIEKVFLSNSYPKATDEYFIHLIRFLHRNVDDYQQKAYLREMLRYL